MRRTGPVIDEIMQQEVRPLLAVDVIEQLHRQFALLSGGRGRDGAPIITMPEYLGFNDLSEEDFLNVITYLTSVPSQEAASIGFIIIMDRRRDKWAAVKSTLARIAGAFPGNLQLVLVLRPTRFLQRTITDIGIRLHRDDFKMKVVMLSSLSDLHSYVDAAQLTSDLGGSLEYCHSQWIHHRTAIESFAVTVKTTAQTLHRFGADLAETELPGDVQSARELLSDHTEKHDTLQEELKLAVKQGTTLLSCIKEQVNRNTGSHLSPDEEDNATVVERLVAQLDETESSFEQFWSKHHLSLEQCLQLRHFEQDFQEVTGTLGCLAEELVAILDFGDSVEGVEQLLKDLKDLEEKAQEPLEMTRRQASHGDQLIQSNHYAADAIQSMCAELRHVCDDFVSKTERKRHALEKSYQIHEKLDKMNKWCESGVYLLAAQAVDRCHTQEGAESALRDVQAFLEVAEQQQLADPKDLVTGCTIALPPNVEAKVQEALDRLEEVQKMFEKRQASLTRLSTKHTRPVQPVAPHPESSPKHSTSITQRSASPAPHRWTSEGPSVSRPPSDADPAKRRNIRRQKGSIKIEVMHEASQGGSSHMLAANETDESLFDRRRHIMNELIETERLYVEELRSIMQGYVAELERNEFSHLVPAALEHKKEVLFGNLFEIYEFHNRTFRKELENCIENPELVAGCFLKRKEDLKMYEKYCQNKPRSEALWRQCGECAFFQECQKKLDHKLSLDAYLLKPVQRITKYQLILKEMLKCSNNSEDTAELEEALTTMLDIIKSVNDSMHQIAITGFAGDLKNLGKLLMQGSFNVWTEHKKGHSKVKDLARFKPMQRHLFLYNSILLFCKRREEVSEGHEKTPSYSFKHSLQMSEVGITENVKGDNRKFEVWYNGREEVYIIQAPSADVKNMWVSEMRKVLTEQLEACREARQLHQRAADPIPHPAGSTSAARTVRKVALRQSNSSSPEVGIRWRSCSPGGGQQGEALRRRHTQTGPEAGYPKSTRHHVKSDPTPLGCKGWAQRRVDAEDFERIPSSAEELSVSSEDEANGRNEDRFRVRLTQDAETAQDLPLGVGDVVQFLEETENGQWLVKNLVTQKMGLVPPRLLRTAGGAHVYSDTDIFSDLCSAALMDTEEKDDD
ncbi:guanine nucleotide exchange factor DBS-like isoform X2 [Scleropages formosus]|uniref:Guanine nucleotide exchange factor DBS-like n=1 Tax=Scleropages formosus TaxID=113540 RepID=A0A8C9RQV0_SCLFO|nr:guanine nucleotide exchange factor DBS-like isoform X2 [Scleropages formosus]